MLSIGSLQMSWKPILPYSSSWCIILQNIPLNWLWESISLTNRHYSGTIQARQLYCCIRLVDDGSSTNRQNDHISAVIKDMFIRCIWNIDTIKMHFLSTKLVLSQNIFHLVRISFELPKCVYLLPHEERVINCVSIICTTWNLFWKNKIYAANPELSCLKRNLFSQN